MPNRAQVDWKRAETVHTVGIHRIHFGSHPQPSERPKCAPKRCLRSSAGRLTPAWAVLGPAGRKVKNKTRLRPCDPARHSQCTVHSAHRWKPTLLAVEGRPKCAQSPQFKSVGRGRSSSVFLFIQAGPVLLYPTPLTFQKPLALGCFWDAPPPPKQNATFVYKELRPDTASFCCRLPSEFLIRAQSCVGFVLTKCVACDRFVLLFSFNYCFLLLMAIVFR